MQPGMTGNRTCHQQQRQPMNLPSYGGNMYQHQARTPRMSNPPPNAIVYPSGSVGGMPISTYGSSVYNTQANAPLPSPSNYCNLGSNAHISTQTHPADVNFRNLPFFKIRHRVIPPIVLIQNSPMSLLPAVQKSSNQEFHVSFVLTCEMASALAMNRDSTKNEYNIMAQLRITAKDNNNVANQEYDDFLPLGLFIRVNGRQCTTMPLPAPTTRQGVESRRIPRPINISHMLRLSPMNVNSIVVNWASETGKDYVMSLNLVEKLSSGLLLSKLKERPTISIDITKRIIREQFKRVLDDDDDAEDADADDDDISATIVRVSLQCPLAKFRMSFPAKGRNCNHLQCFDGSAYIYLNEKKPMWNCPVCNKPLYFEDLLIDQYFVDVLKSDQLMEECQEVQLFVDGTWKSYEDNPDSNDTCSRKDSACSPTGSSNEASTTDSGVKEEKYADHKDITTRVTTSEPNANNATDPVVDLTCEEEEDSPNEHENGLKDNICANSTTNNICNMETTISMTPSLSNNDHGLESSLVGTNNKNSNDNDDESAAYKLKASVTSTLRSLIEGNTSNSIISLDSPSPSPPNVSSTSPPPSTIASLHIADS